MNVYGIGIDLVETKRIAKLIETHGERFLHRCFTQAEIDYCQSHANSNQSFAARWAAKEAVAKAFGTGIGAELALTELEVIKLPSGQPAIQLHAGSQAFANRLGVTEVKISLTHTQDHAAAYAMVLTD
jgi:holo-[acyl-carrier protein] synthase